ncbi:hypothetical protein KP509_03G051600 [Ceratopteris richardii]|nr:hypothetical protein KP509_03G051600 [Ceratopteris richardii]
MDKGFTNSETKASSQTLDLKSAAENRRASGCGLKNDELEDSVVTSSPVWGVSDATLCKQSGYGAWGSEVLNLNEELGGNTKDMDIDGADNQERQKRLKKSSDEGFLHPSRRKNRETHEDPIDESRCNGKFGPSGSNVVPLGKRRYGKQADLSHPMLQGETSKSMEFSQDKDSQAWDQSSRENVATDCFPLVKDHEDGLRACENLSDTQPSGGDWKKDSSVAWDSPDERRSGKFGPSGSNMMPLGKRRYGKKIGSDPMSANVGSQCMGFSEGRESQTLLQSSIENVSGGKLGWSEIPQGEMRVFQNAELPDHSGQQTAWGPSSWSNENVKEKHDAISNTGSQSIDEGPFGRGSAVNQQDNGNMEQADEQWGRTPANKQCQQEAEIRSMRGDGLICEPNRDNSSSHGIGWTSEEQIISDEWCGNKSSCAPFNPASKKIIKAPQENSNSWLRMPSKLGEAPFPRKRTYKGPAEGFRGRGVDSSRYRVKSFLREHSELNELYMKSNYILHQSGYQLGEKLKAEDESFILEKILIHHPERKAKVGCGVDYVMIDSHAQHQVACFWVVQNDGLKTDFSYWKCLEHLLKTKFLCHSGKDLEKGAISKDIWNAEMGSIVPTEGTCGQNEQNVAKQDVSYCWNKEKSSHNANDADQDHSKVQESWADDPSTPANTVGNYSQFEAEETLRTDTVSIVSNMMIVLTETACTQDVQDAAKQDERDDWNSEKSSPDASNVAHDQAEIQGSWTGGSSPPAHFTDMHSQIEAEEALRMETTSLIFNRTVVPKEKTCSQDVHDMAKQETIHDWDKDKSSNDVDNVPRDQGETQVNLTTGSNTRTHAIRMYNHIEAEEALRGETTSISSYNSVLFR